MEKGKNMRVLVTGANGQLGYDVVKKLQNENVECLGIDRDVLDITDKFAVMYFIHEYNPTVVVHCAAYTAVDKAEDEKELCYNINVLGTEYIASACKAIDAKMVYISTDYVFSGEGVEPYKETDIPNPVNYYGTTKYQGELNVQKILDKYFIIRISWVFGVNGDNFVKTMLRLFKERNEVHVVTDQIGSPTYTWDLAHLIHKVILTDKFGTYHATNEGFCSWFSFAKEIAIQSKSQVDVKEILAENYPTKAKRPMNSRLSKENTQKVFGYKLPCWKNALSDYLNALLLKED